MKRTFLSFAWFFCCLGSLFSQAMPQKPASAAATEDSIRFSLLTCGAGEEIYSLFGHTAIRYENFTRNINAVFNYGMFSFDTPNFILRFTLGKTDYQLGVTPYKQFAYEYARTGRDVWQQTLDLDRKEKKRLLALLEENYLPRNRTYRYNFFYDNCSTRPRDQIEHAAQGALEYTDDMDTPRAGTSFRDIVHQHTVGHSWARFGIDLCLGSRADESISRRQMMFAPFYLKDFLAKARLRDAQDTKRPLVCSEEHIIQCPRKAATEEGLTPLGTTCLLFIAVAAVTAYDIYRRKSLWTIDFLLFSAAGVTGCILAILAIFSQHPAVSPNYLLFLFHPLYLLCLPWMIQRVRKKRKSIYMWANITVLTFFVLLWGIIPQEFNLAVLPLALCLWLRSASNLYLIYIRK